MIRTVWITLLATFGSVGLAGVAVADDGDIRQAGGEESFRAIERFPEDDQEPDVEVAAVDEDSLFAAVVDDVEHEHWEAAREQIDSSDVRSDIEADPERQFLAGYVAYEAGAADEALEWFDEIDGDFEILSDYLALYTAKAAMDAGDAHRATVEAASVPRESRLHDDALLLLAQALEEAGEREDRERAIEVLELYIGEYGSRNDGPRARLLLGEMLESLERPGDAAETYLELRERHPLRDETDRAEERLRELSDVLEDRMADRIDEDSLERTMRRYRGLHNLHRSERVIDELGEELDDISDEAISERCEALYMVADSHTKLRRHGDAVAWYDQVLDECADVENYEIRALYRTARSRWNAGNYDGALTHWERIWTEYPEHSFADDAKYFTARILRSDGRPDEARDVLHRQVERYPTGDMAKDAHWLIVRDHFERDDYDGVVEYVDELEDTREDDLYTRGRLHYFRGRALEMAGDDGGAQQAFENVARDHPMTYYGLLAINRLARVEGEDVDDVCQAARQLCDELLPEQRSAGSIEVTDQLQSDDAFERGSTLLSLGLSSMARAEFSDLRDRHASDDATLWALARLLDDAGAHHISHDIARRHIDGWMDQYPNEANRAMWEIAYPTPFSDDVTDVVQRRDGVDASKVYAIMREESGFNPRIESWANARGLLQLLDDTAQRMAQRIDFDGYSFEQLDEPNTNVRLGTAYMEHLGERLEAHPVLVSAGYNGGRGNVNNWLDEFGDLPVDLFVEDIPFHQTRNYAKRVTMSYWIYSYLYGDRRAPRLDFELLQ